MSYITGNLPPIKVWLKEEYLYDDPFRVKEKKYKLIPAVLLTVRCLTGQVPLFTVLLNNGVMRDKLPSAALLTLNERPEEELEFDILCLWNSFSNKFTVTTINYLYNSQVTVYCKDRKFREGYYLFTIDWASNDYDNDLTLAEDASEHKCHHVIELKDGQIALQPNNRVIWNEPSFTTESFPENPDYQINTRYWDAENKEKWKTENSDNYFYDNK